MALRRVKGAYSNPRVMKTALDLIRKNRPREEIVSAIQKKYFPKYTLEEVKRAFSPKGDPAVQIVQTMESVRPGNKSIRMLVD